MPSPLSARGEGMGERLPARNPTPNPSPFTGRGIPRFMLGNLGILSHPKCRATMTKLTNTSSKAAICVTRHAIVMPADLPGRL